MEVMAELIADLRVHMLKIMFIKAILHIENVQAEMGGVEWVSLTIKENNYSC